VGEISPLEQLELALLRAHEGQLAWVFVREYLRYRKIGLSVEVAADKVLEELKIPKLREVKKVSLWQKLLA